ncbi:MAG: PD-(D/E)XK nuclease family protein, partial [Actinomycetota bacterium]|nr:PD-(D/E)XK nuclease family protein [Actinomycetota bacterium]
AERLRLYYVAMTRAIDRLIVSGAIDRDRKADASTPIGWVLERLDADEELEGAGDGPVELERGAARLIVRVDRHRPQGQLEPADDLPPLGAQLELFVADGPPALPVAPTLPALEPVPLPQPNRVRRLSFSALALFERCSYRFYAERIVGMRPTDASGLGSDSKGLAATEIGDAVHFLLEHVELASPRAPEPGTLAEAVRARYPGVTEDELDRIAAFVSSYCSSELAARVAELPGAAPEQSFAIEHDGVLLRGRLDVLLRGGSRWLVLDYKTNSLAEGSPEEIVERDYRLQRLVYALACLRAGAEEVEVVYAFLERPDAVVSAVFRPSELPELEAELSAAIARIQAGEFRPTPGEFVCAGCPALGVVCAGPGLDAEWSPSPHGALSVI